VLPDASTDVGVVLDGGAVSEEEVKLPKRCPCCGGEWDGGFGRLRMEVRGFWPQSQRPIGIYGREDADTVMCRKCFNLYDRAVQALRDANFHWLGAGMEDERKRKAGDKVI
jgi:hypothetical protein